MITIWPKTISNNNNNEKQLNRMNRMNEWKISSTTMIRCLLSEMRVEVESVRIELKRTRSQCTQLPTITVHTKQQEPKQARETNFTSLDFTSRSLRTRASECRGKRRTKKKVVGIKMLLLLFFVLSFVLFCKRSTPVFIYTHHFNKTKWNGQRCNDAIDAVVMNA